MPPVNAKDVIDDDITIDASEVIDDVSPRKAGGFVPELLKATARGTVRGIETGLKAAAFTEKPPTKQLSYDDIADDIKNYAAQMMASIPEYAGLSIEKVGKVAKQIMSEGKLGKPLGEAIEKGGKSIADYYSKAKEYFPTDKGTYITSPLIKQTENLLKHPLISQPEDLSIPLQGYESFIHSLAARALPIAAGLVIPSGKVSVVKAARGAMFGGGSVFGAAKAKEVMDMARQDRPDLSESEIKAIALKAGIWEGVTETALDVAIGKFLGLLGIGVKTPVKETVKKTVKGAPLIKQYLKNVATITPIEIAEEKLQEKGDEWTHEKLGIPFQKDPNLVTTTTVASLLFAGLGVGAQRVKANQMLKVLADPKADIKERAEIAVAVSNVMFKKSKSAATNWITQAQEAIYNKQPIDINEKILKKPKESTVDLTIPFEEVIDDAEIEASPKERNIQGDAFDTEAYGEDIEKGKAYESKQKTYEDIVEEQERGGFTKSDIGDVVGIDADTGLPIIKRKEGKTNERKSGSSIKQAESGVSDAEGVALNEGYAVQKGNVPKDEGQYEKGKDVNKELSSTAIEPSEITQAAQPPLEPPVPESGKINAITRKEAGDMIAKGNPEVIPHIKDGIKQGKVSPMQMQDAIRNESLAQVADASKAERPIIRDNIKKLQPQIDEALKGQQEIPIVESIAQDISQAKASGQSFDEWVKGQGELYHGSDVDINKFDMSKVKKWNKFGHFFSPDKEAVKVYGDKINQAVVEVKNPKIITQKQWWDIRGEHAKDDIWFSNWKNELKSQGYDGLLVKGSKEQFAGKEVKNPEIIAVFEDAQIKTRSQLKAEWDKMQKAEVKPTAPPDYGMKHRPPTIEQGGSPLYDLTQSFPEDIYSVRAMQYYGEGNKILDKITLSIFNSIKGKPDAKIKIYRAIPNEAKEGIQAGDWVTVNKQYARNHGEMQFGKDFRIIEKNVQAKEVVANADSIHEQGYYPDLAKAEVKPPVEAKQVKSRELHTYKVGDIVDINGKKVKIISNIKDSFGEPQRVSVQAIEKVTKTIKDKTFQMPQKPYDISPFTEITKGEGKLAVEKGKPSPESVSIADDVVKNVYARIDTILGKGTVSAGFKPSASILERLGSDIQQKALGEHGLKLGDTFKVAGLYQHTHTMTGNGLKHIITLAEELKNRPKELQWTAFHEPFHGIKEILRQQASQGNKEAQGIIDTLKAEFKNEEAEADAFADFGMKKAETGLSAKVRAIFERIMRFFRQLGDYLAGKGISSKEQVNRFFEDVWKGEYADKWTIRDIETRGYDVESKTSLAMGAIDYLYRSHNIKDLNRLYRDGLVGKTPQEAHDLILKAHPEYAKEWEDAGVSRDDETWGVDDQETQEPRIYFAATEKTGYKGDFIIRIKKDVVRQYGEIIEDSGLPNEFFIDGRGYIPIKHIEVKSGRKWVSLVDFYNQRHAESALSVKGEFESQANKETDEGLLSVKKPLDDRVQGVVDFVNEKGKMPTKAWLEKVGLTEDEISEFFKKMPSKKVGKVTESIAKKTAQEAYKQGKKIVKDEIKKITEEQKVDNAIKRLTKMKKSMSLDFQKMIKDIGSKDKKKINPEVVRKLSQWLDSINPDDIGMSERMAEELKEKLSDISDKDYNDMSMAEKKVFADTLKLLKAHDFYIRSVDLTLKGHDVETQRQRLLKSTSSLDAKEGIFRAGGKEAYVKTLTGSRVANMLDNFKDDGVNQELIFNQFITENEAEWQAVEQTRVFTEKAKAIKAEWTTEEQQRIVVKALDIMGATTQRDVLMEEMWIVEVPELTKDETALMNLIEETMNENKQNIKTVFEGRENQIFPEIARYIFPLKYEKQDNNVNTEVLRHDYHRTKESDDYFTEQRAKGVKKLIRTDLFNIVREGLQAQNWYFHMQPVLDTQASLLFSKEYMAKAGDLGDKWWRDQIDIVARRGYSARSATMFAFMDKALREGRINLNKAVMSYKASSAMMQIFSGFDAMAYGVIEGMPMAAVKMPMNIAKAWLFKNPELYKMSKAIQLRDGGEQAFKELLEKDRMGKWAEIGFRPLREADLRTALGVLQTYYDALGGTADKLNQAELMMMLSQGGTSISLRPHVLAGGEMWRTAFTFQTFFLNRWGLVAHDIINKSIIHGDARQKIRGANALAIIIMASLLEDEAREYLYSLITGKHYKNVSMAKRVFSAIPETIPLVGRAISAKIQGRMGDTDVPIVRTAKTGLVGAYDAVFADEGAKKVQGALKAIEMILSVKYGVGGTAQIMDLIEGALPETTGQTNQQKAYYNRKIAEAYIKGDKEKAHELRQEAREKGYKISITSINKHRKKAREED